MGDGFRWDESYSIGVDALDADHKRLLSLGNAVLEASSEGQGQEAVHALLDALHVESTEHFAREEALMRDARFPLLQDHHEHHDRLTAELHLFIQQYEVGHLDAGKLANFLVSWVVQHIVEQDMKFQAHCVAVGFGLDASDHARPDGGALRRRD